MDETDVIIIVVKQKALAEELEKLRINFSKDSPTRKTQKYKDERLKIYGRNSKQIMRK